MNSTKNAKKLSNWLRVLSALLPVTRRKLAILGSLAVIAGTLLVNTSSFGPLHFIPAGLSRVDDLEHAWSLLREYGPFEGEFGVMTRITPEVTGFASLLRLLERQQRVDLSGIVTSIYVESHMFSGDDIQRIGRYAVLVQYENDLEPRVVAWVEDVSQWIMNERLRWSLLHGLPVLSGGLLLSLLSMFLSATSKDGQLSRISNNTKRRMSLPLLKPQVWVPWSALLVASAAFAFALSRFVPSEWSTAMIALAALTQAFFAALLWKASQANLNLSREFHKWTTDQYRMPLRIISAEVAYSVSEGEISFRMVLFNPNKSVALVDGVLIVIPAFGDKVATNCIWNAPQINKEAPSVVPAEASAEVMSSGKLPSFDGGPPDVRTDIRTLLLQHRSASFQLNWSILEYRDGRDYSREFGAVEVVVMDPQEEPA